MIPTKEVRVVNSAIGDKENLYIGKISEFVRRQRIRFNGFPISSKLLSLYVDTLRLVVWGDHAHYYYGVGLRVVEGRFIAILDLFNNEICRDFAPSRGLAIINNFHNTSNRHGCPSWRRCKREFDPWPLVFPHGIKLGSHDNELIDRSDRQYDGEDCDNTISQAALSPQLTERLPPVFQSFAQSHGWLLFFWSCSTAFFGVSCVLLVFLQTYATDKLLRLALVVFALSLVFALAHIRKLPPGVAPHLNHPAVPGSAGNGSAPCVKGSTFVRTS